MLWALPHSYRKQGGEKVPGEAKRASQEVGLQDRQLWSAGMANLSNYAKNTGYAEDR